MGAGASASLGEDGDMVAEVAAKAAAGDKWCPEMQELWDQSKDDDGFCARGKVVAFQQSPPSWFDVGAKGAAGGGSGA